MVMDAAAGPTGEDRLYGLMEVVERRQAAVQAALDGLAAERAALAREPEALLHGVQDVHIRVQGAVLSGDGELGRGSDGRGGGGAGGDSPALVPFGPND